MDAERETDSLKKTEFMLDKIGMEFEGIISSVTGFGLFVELPNTVEFSPYFYAKKTITTTL